MNLLKHSPVLPLSYNDTYDQNVRCYGKPPKGYRWLKVGDKTSDQTLLVTPWQFIGYPYGETVQIDQWPAIEPIAKATKAKPETIGNMKTDAMEEQLGKPAHAPAPKTELELLRDQIASLTKENAELKAWKEKVLAATKI